MAADRTTRGRLSWLAVLAKPVSSGRLGRLGRFAPAALVVLLVALLVAGGVLGFKLREAYAVQDRRAAILHAARQQALDFISLDYRHANRDIQRVLDGAAGDFKKQYSNSRKQLQKLIKQNKAISKGEVLSAGIVSSDADSARVIIVADSQVDNVSTKKPRPRHYRLQMDLVHKNGRWLTTNLRFVG